MKTSVMRIWLPLLLMAALSAPSFAARLIGMNDNTGEFYEIDPSVPSASFLGDASTDVSLSGLAYDSANGRLWVSDTCGDNCFGLGWVDMNTWQITEIGGFVSTSNIHALAYDWDQNILFGWDIENNQLVSLDRGTGEETYLGDPSGPAIVGMTYDPIGRRLLGASRSDQRLYSIDPSTYTVTDIGALGADPGGLFGLAWEPDTNRLYLGSDSGDLYEVNPATGSATLLGNTGYGIGALAAISGPTASVQPVPVNSVQTNIMLILAILLIAGLTGFRRFA